MTWPVPLTPGQAASYRKALLPQYGGARLPVRVVSFSRVESALRHRSLAHEAIGLPIIDAGPCLGSIMTIPVFSRIAVPDLFGRPTWIDASAFGEPVVEVGVKIGPDEPWNVANVGVFYVAGRTQGVLFA